MVGEEEVTDINEYNSLPPSKGQLVPLKRKGDFERGPYPEWTYFIRDAVGIKIGRSISPQSRMRDLQGGNGSRLELLLAVPAAKLSEPDAHARFRHLRIHREWFRPEQELLDFIEELKGPKPKRDLAPYYAAAMQLRRALRTMPRAARQFAYNAIQLMESDAQPTGCHRIQQPKYSIQRQLDGLERALRQ